jgi:hypothetical protein
VHFVSIGPITGGHMKNKWITDSAYYEWSVMCSSHKEQPLDGYVKWPLTAGERKLSSSRYCHVREYLLGAAN